MSFLISAMTKDDRWIFLKDLGFNPASSCYHRDENFRSEMGRYQMKTKNFLYIILDFSSFIFNYQSYNSNYFGFDHEKYTRCFRIFKELLNCFNFGTKHCTVHQIEESQGYMSEPTEKLWINNSSLQFDVQFISLHCFFLKLQ